ncbi:unnamed protein product [Coffea canephora]|uniref:Bifunctional inhibitor/plant lipid transfer protein/seed storage helical domain-containing protein n=1 Tax=Coffea canephora TaxID=49390 RepID=A0A068U4E4_COFCA|nr:unnamed protein product [Coffea canephora]
MERMKSKLSMICICIATVAIVAVATIQEDEKDCADQLTNLAACIPYVSGDEKIPTPECCEDTKKVKSAKPKCLCVLIKESTDPSMGLPINTTLALKMPSACKIDAKVSDCPSILNLAPDSPDAKIFEAASKDSSTSSSTTNSPPASASTSSSSSGSSTSPSSSRSSSSSATKPTTSSSIAGAKLCQSSLVIAGSAVIALLLL